MVFTHLSTTANIMATAVVALGVMTITLAVYVAYCFNRSTKTGTPQAVKLAKALKYQILGECVITCGTLTFAIATYTGALHNWSLYFVSGIRVLMFFASAATTVYLYKTVRQISDD